MPGRRRVGVRSDAGSDLSPPASGRGRGREWGLTEPKACAPRPSPTPPPAGRGALWAEPSAMTNGRRAGRTIRRPFGPLPSRRREGSGEGMGSHRAHNPWPSPLPNPSPCRERGFMGRARRYDEWAQGWWNDPTPVRTSSPPAGGRGRGRAWDLTEPKACGPRPSPTPPPAERGASPDYLPAPPRRRRALSRAASRHALSVATDTSARSKRNSCIVMPER